MPYYQVSPPPISPSGNPPIREVRPDHKIESVLALFSPLYRRSALSPAVIVVAVAGDARHCVTMLLLNLFAFGTSTASRC